MEPALQTLRDSVREAASQRASLNIQGGNTKHFYGREPAGTPLSTVEYKGVVAYQPTELVITAKAGTPIAEVEAVLAERGQMLAFEPPRFGPDATVGGMVATGLSGPRRPYVGAVRDFVLGVSCLNSSAEVLRFGGQVMKNVAGFDVSRLMTGALGTLGVILDVSLKVLPIPPLELTLTWAATEEDAIGRMTAWAGQPQPISAGVYHAGTMLLRLSGASAALTAAQKTLGGDVHEDAVRAWEALREQRWPFFETAGALWRISLPPASPPLNCGKDTIVDWGGAQRWVTGVDDETALRERARKLGGHVTAFRGGVRSGGVFTTLDVTLLALHRRIKAVFDPHGIFNRGRLYPEL